MATDPQPTGVRGYLDDISGFGIDGFGALVDMLLEQDPRLIWPQTIDTYSRMRVEPQITAILAAYNLAAGRANWTIDPAGCRDEVVELIADDLGLPILGYSDTPPDESNPDAKFRPPTGARRRKFRWSEHQRLAMLKLVFGHMFFEQSYAAQGGQWRLDSVQERMPQTVQEVHLNADGTIASVEQHARKSGDGPKITTFDHRLVYHVNAREGSNYFGRSMLRPSFPLWVIKGEVLRVHATSIRRFGLGIFEVQAPPGATPQQVAEAQRYAANYRAGEHGGAGLPHGFSSSLRGLTGNVPDAVAFLNYLDRQMTRSTLTSLLDMATAERGNRSLGETVMDLMVYSQTDVCESIADVGTSQMVVPLVDANFGEDEPAPQIVVTDVGADVELTAQDLNWLLEYGGIKPDAPWRAWVRERWDMPEEDPNDPVFAVPTDNADPNSAGGQGDG